jgi:hypothetical protein
MLNRIRKIILSSDDKYINYFKFNTDYKKQILKELLDKLKNMQLLKSTDSKYNGYKFINVVFGEDYYGEDIIPYAELINDYSSNNIGLYNDINGSSRDDILIGSLNNDQHIKTISKISFKNMPLSDYEIDNSTNNTSKTPFFVSYNQNISFGIKGLQEFSLLRVKINFRPYYIVQRNGKNYMGAINAPGEFIDVSIPYVIGDTLTTFDWAQLKTYNMKYQTESFNFESFNFESYTVEEYFNDIIRMLFNVNNMPWENEKYQKRLKRLALLGFIDILSKLNTNLKFKKTPTPTKPNTPSGLKTLNNIFDMHQKNIFTIIQNESTFGTNLHNLENIFRQLKETFGSLDLLFAKLFDNIELFIQRYKTNPTQNDKFIKFVSDILYHYNNIISISTSIEALNKTNESILNTNTNIVLQQGGSETEKHISKHKFSLKKKHDLIN